MATRHHARGRAASPAHRRRAAAAGPATRMPPAAGGTRSSAAATQRLSDSATQRLSDSATALYPTGRHSPQPPILAEQNSPASARLRQPPPGSLRPGQDLLSDRTRLAARGDKTRSEPLAAGLVTGIPRPAGRRAPTPFARAPAGGMLLRPPAPVRVGDGRSSRGMLLQKRYGTREAIEFKLEGCSSSPRPSLRPLALAERHTAQTPPPRLSARPAGRRGDVDALRRATARRRPRVETRAHGRPGARRAGSRRRRTAPRRGAAAAGSPAPPLSRLYSARVRTCTHARREDGQAAPPSGCWCAAST